MAVVIGLGCMRLSTAPVRDHTRAIATIHAALDAGATLLDTADAYAHDAGDSGHNERLIAEALRSWQGDRFTVTVATKGGLTRPGGRWVPDGRATHLRSACEASRRALGVDTIDLYQLHAPDPRTPIETSVRALAELQREGCVRDIGLCNVNVGQIETARAIVAVAAVQVGLSVLDDENFRNGVAGYCRDHGIRLIAHRPLGGQRSHRLARDPLLLEIGRAHAASPHEIALAWLCDLDPGVTPVPGATRVETARSIARVLAIRLTDEDRDRLDHRFPAARTLRLHTPARHSPASTDADVVIVMGPPAAGKSSVARELEDAGYARLNRDSRGGRLADLVAALDAGLAAGRRRWVLDNTYPQRRSRNEVIECAWRHGVPVRCVLLDTSTADAQINAITRMIEVHGRLPMPDELKSLGRADPRFFGPDAQFRYERQVEPPVLDEGFASIEPRPFVRRLPATHTGRAVILDFDDIFGARTRRGPVLDPADVSISPLVRDVLAGHVANRWTLLALAWRPQLALGSTTSDVVRACFQRARDRLGLDIDVDVCPHPGGPPVCWCRKPLPGLVVQFAIRHRIALPDSVLIGRTSADRTLARKLGLDFQDTDAFFTRP